MLMVLAGLPKDERSRVGERGKRGAVLQCDWAAELRGPPAVSGAAPHRVPLTRCLGCRMEQSRACSKGETVGAAQLGVL
jgi:hypothetical protein